MKTGFDGRVFLFEYEWLTYNRRMPVRYIRKKHSEFCQVCGEVETDDNKFEHSHRIPFNVGIKKFGLTPDYLDSHDNIITAHRKSCNKSAELNEIQIKEFLLSKGFELPEYLTT